VNKTIRLDPSSPESYFIAAELQRWKAEWYQDSIAAQHIDEGLKMIDKIIQISPRIAKAFALQGVLYIQKLQLEKEPAARELAARQAHEALTKALRLNKHLSNEYQSYLNEAEAGVQ
jgi:hypothetical protein